MFYKTVLLLLLFSNPVNASITMYENCTLQLLDVSCTLSQDTKAPKYMRDQWIASCFAGEQTIKTTGFKGQNIFKEAIIKNNFKKENVSYLISDTLKCIKDPDELKRCSLLLTKDAVIGKTQACKYFTESPILNLLKTAHGIKSNAYTLNLSKKWKLKDVAINQDNYKYSFENNKNEKLQLTISDYLDEKQYLISKDEVKKSIKNGISFTFQKNGMRLVKHNVLNLGSHKLTDQIIGVHEKTKLRLIQYFVYGKDRIAIFSLGEKIKHKKLIKEMQEIVNRFKWNNP